MSEELNFVLQARREKLAALEAAGVPPFAYAYDRTHSSVDAVAAMPEGAEQGPVVRVAGRLTSWRGQGKTASSTSSATSWARSSSRSRGSSTSPTSSA